MDNCCGHGTFWHKVGYKYWSGVHAKCSRHVLAPGYSTGSTLEIIHPPASPVMVSHNWNTGVKWNGDIKEKNNLSAHLLQCIIKIVNISSWMYIISLINTYLLSINTAVYISLICHWYIHDNNLFNTAWYRLSTQQLALYAAVAGVVFVICIG